MDILSRDMKSSARTETKTNKTERSRPGIVYSLQSQDDGDKTRQQSRLGQRQSPGCTALGRRHRSRGHVDRGRAAKGTDQQDYRIIIVGDLTSPTCWMRR